MAIASKTLAKTTFADKQIMLKYLNFLDSLIIKCSYDANVDETNDKKIAGDKYILAVNGNASIYDYDITSAELSQIGLSSSEISAFNESKGTYLSNISEESKEKILTYYNAKTISEYKETNAYYILLHGEPAIDEDGNTYTTYDYFDGTTYHKNVTKSSMAILGITVPAVNSKEVIWVSNLYDGNVIHTVHQLQEYNSTDYPDMYLALTANDNELLNTIFADAKSNDHYYDYLDYILRKISYYDARNAKNFEILYINNNYLSERELHDFYNIYYKVRDYILTVSYVENYGKTEELYDRYISIIILFYTMLHFINKKIDSFIRNNYSNMEDIRLFFKQYNMESLTSSLSITDLKKIIANIESLIKLKGTEKVITKILSIFGITNINLYKYLLVKTPKYNSITKALEISSSKTKDENYDLFLVKIPIEDTDTKKSITYYISDSSNWESFSTITKNDTYFGNTRYFEEDSTNQLKENYIEEIKAKLLKDESFSYFYTKYIGIITHINIATCLIQANYLMNMIKNSNVILNTSCSISGITGNITIKNLLAGMEYIKSLRSNITSTIIQNTESINNCIMGFNKSPSLSELKNKTVKIFKYNASNNTVELNDIKINTILDSNDIKIVNTALAESSNDIDEIIAAYYSNIQIYNNYIDAIYKESDYLKYEALLTAFNYNFLIKLEPSIFGTKYNTYEEYIKNNSNNLYTYIQDTLTTTYGDSNLWYTNGSPSTNFIDSCINLMSTLLEGILTSLSISTIYANSTRYTYIDNTSTFSKILSIIEYFKSYTTQFASTDVSYTINDNHMSLIKLIDYIPIIKSTDILRHSIGESIVDYIDDYGKENISSTLKLRESCKQLSEEYGYDKLNIIHKLNQLYSNKEDIRKLIKIHHKIHESRLEKITSNINNREYIDESSNLVKYQHTINMTDKLVEITS